MIVNLRAQQGLRKRVGVLCASPRGHSWFMAERRGGLDFHVWLQHVALKRAEGEPGAGTRLVPEGVGVCGVGVCGVYSGG